MRKHSISSSKPYMVATVPTKSFYWRAAIVASLSLSATPALFAASIGVNFVETAGSGVQNGVTDALAAGEIAGVPAYAQSNWNNVGRWSDPIAMNDNLGAGTSVSIAWDSKNTWHSGSGLTTSDNKLMSGYLDATGQLNQSSFTSIYADNANKPLVYVTGVSSWSASQSADSFNLIVYFDGDTTGRVGEYWLQSVTGGHTNFTLGADITPHIFGRDFGIFSGTYDAVDPSATSLAAAEDGNYILFSGIPASADTFLIRTEEQTARVQINAFQIVAVPEASTTELLGFGVVGLAMWRRRLSATHSPDRWNSDESVRG